MRTETDGKLYKHYTEVEDFWDDERWPNFRPYEFACKCCGEFYFDEWFFDAIQQLRTALGYPVTINSAHRCPKHNKAEGGSKKSRHLRLALDISTLGHRLKQMFAFAKEAGFTSFGFYGSFLHMDDRPGRRWFSKQGRKKWDFVN